MDERVTQSVWALVAKAGVPDQTRVRLVREQLAAIDNTDMAGASRLAAVLGMPEHQGVVVSAYTEGSESAMGILAQLAILTLVQPEETGRRRRRVERPSEPTYARVVGQ